jgi:hypothetical protein
MTARWTGLEDLGGELGDVTAAELVAAIVAHAGLPHAGDHPDVDHDTLATIVDLLAHLADTSVHGIADTTVLATDAELAAAIAVHSGTPHAGDHPDVDHDTLATIVNLDAAKAALGDPLPAGSFLVPVGTLGTVPLTNGSMLMVPHPRLRAGHVVSKIGAPLTIAGTVGSTSLRYGLWTYDAASPSSFVLLTDCGVLADPTVADTEAAAMLTLASPFTIPTGTKTGQVLASVVLQGTPATSPTIRGLTGVGSPNVLAGYPGGSMRPGVSRTGITGALPATTSGAGITTTAPWIIVKTG